MKRIARNSFSCYLMKSDEPDGWLIVMSGSSGLSGDKNNHYEEVSVVCMCCLLIGSV